MIEIKSVKYLMRDTRFSQQWKFKSRSSGLWCCAALW